MRTLRYVLNAGTCLLVAGLLTAVAPASARGQATSPAEIVPAPPGKTQRVTLRDGSQLQGRILSVDSTSVQFESSLGVTTIPIASIIAVKTAAPGTVSQGKYYFRNPNATRLIFAPTGRMLAQGEGYFTDFWVFFPGFAHGVTNRFTIGGGMSILPGIDVDKQMFFLTPKFGVVQRENLNVAVGALALSLPTFDGDKRVSAGLLYGVSTWGTMDHSLTAGLGYGYVGGTLGDRPTVMLGGETRAAPRISFVTENYIFPGGEGLISAAIRFMGQDISVDLGLGHPTGAESFTFPLLNFVWKW